MLKELIYITFIILAVIVLTSRDDIFASHPIIVEKYTVLNIQRSLESILPLAVLYPISNVEI